MSELYLSSVLGILRLLKNTEGLGGGQSAHQFLVKWSEPDADEEIVMRVAGYIQAQISGAHSFIHQSDFVPEGKAGLLETIAALKAAFGLSGLSTQINSYLPALDASLSQFAILVSIVGRGPDLKSSKDLASIIKEVEKLYQSLLKSEMDVGVRDLARKQLHILLTLLRNLEVMGVEAAMAAYAELFIRLRTATASASEQTKAEVAKFWPTIEGWSKRLGAIQKLYAAGVAIVGYGKPLLALIKG